MVRMVRIPDEFREEVREVNRSSFMALLDQLDKTLKPVRIRDEKQKRPHAGVRHHVDTGNELQGIPHEHRDERQCGQSACQDAEEAGRQSQTLAG